MNHYVVTLPFFSFSLHVSFVTVVNGRRVICDQERFFVCLFFLPNVFKSTGKIKIKNQPSIILFGFVRTHTHTLTPCTVSQLLRQRIFKRWQRITYSCFASNGFFLPFIFACCCCEFVANEIEKFVVFCKCNGFFDWVVVAFFLVSFAFVHFFVGIVFCVSPEYFSRSLQQLIKFICDEYMRRRLRFKLTGKQANGKNTLGHTNTDAYRNRKKHTHRRYFDAVTTYVNNGINRKINNAEK